MVTVSVVSLGVLWAFAASIALGEGLNLRGVKTVQDHYGYPAGALGSALQAERRLSMVYLGGRVEGDRASMESGRLVTDRQADLFRRLAADDGARDAAPENTRRLADKIIKELDGLDDRRRAIDTLRTDRSRAFADYTALLNDVGSLQGSLATLDNSEVAKDARNEASLNRAREVLAQEDALLAGAIAAGRMTPEEHAQFVKLVGTQRTLYDYSASELRSADQAYYQRVVGMPEYSRFRTLEDHFVASANLVRTSGPTARRAVEDHRRLQPDPAPRPGAGGVRGRRAARRADLRGHHHPRRPRGRARARRRRRHPRPRDLGRPLRHPRAGPAAPRGDRPRRRPAAERDPPAAPRRRGRRGRRGAAAGVRHPRDRPGRRGVQRRPPHRHPGRGRGGDAAPQRQRRVRQPRPPQPDAAAPPAEAARLDGAAHRDPRRPGGPVPGRPPRHPHAPGTRKA
ncbi:nitrate- and nitrite sensing domain-containing protein [Actinomadura madurae]|uniref:nitrate- and nitrite sensing domain-containing protein n=1 Tax=Actinomadura madurae TaxID=1993 RepID=UPI0020D2100D|nr:nitrate- and nitrite sensing domain-containing protein [Actinomadura madurae]MCP9970540.1 nitrate- and nitrite sensing domain-containing protein [Actinomadura madurae]